MYKKKKNFINAWIIRIFPHEKQPFRSRVPYACSFSPSTLGARNVWRRTYRTRFATHVRERVKFANAMFEERVGRPDRHGYLRTTRVNVRTPIFSLYGVKAAAAAASKADITLLYYIHTSKHIYIYYLFWRQHSMEKRITLKQWTYGFYIPFCRNIHVFVIVRGTLEGQQIMVDTGINKTGGAHGSVNEGMTIYRWSSEIVCVQHRSFGQKYGLICRFIIYILILYYCIIFVNKCPVLHPLIFKFNVLKELVL